MTVVALARQVGSGGQSIAALLAQRMGYRFVGRRELRAIARERGLDLPQAFVDFADEDRLALDAPDAAGLYLSYGELEFGDALRGVIQASPTAGSPGSLLDRMARERRAVFLLVQGLVYEVAAQDRVVLVGGGSQLILAGVPGVLRVKIIAPEVVRVARLAASRGLSVEAAQAAVRRGDEEQRSYNRAVFDADWDDPLLWDLVINTEHWDVEGVCDIIEGAAHQPHIGGGLTEPVREALALAGRIDLALHGEPTLASSIVYAMPQGDGLALHGETETANQAERALELARSLAGELPIASQIVADPASLTRSSVLERDAPEHWAGG